MSIGSNYEITQTNHADLVRCISASNAYENEYGAQANQDSLDAFSRLSQVGLSEAGFLQAHGMLISNSETCEEGEKGIYRYRRMRVGDRLMPPADLVPELTRTLLDKIDDMPSEKVADVLVKIHPFADGNGRMARLVLYHLNISRDEKLVALEGEHGALVRATYLGWLKKNYPACDADCNPLVPSALNRSKWIKTISLEIAG